MEERRERERDRVLRKFHTRLCCALRGAGPTVIAQKLLEKDVISEELCSELENIPVLVDQSTLLMRSLRCSIIYDEDAFEAFLYVLETSTITCRNLSRKLQQQLEGRGRHLLDSKEEPDIVVTVDPGMQEEYDIMVSSFSAMFSKAMECVYSKVKLKMVKEHIAICYPPIRDVIEKCVSPKKLNAVLREQMVTLVNYGPLIGLAKRFNVQEALSAVDEFTQERDEFFRSVRAKEFAVVTMEKIKAAEGMHVKVKFIVSWAKDTTTLREFQLVLQKVFNEIHPFLTLEAVCHSQLEFLCSLPRFKAEEFAQITQANETQLLKMGVVEVYIGDVQLLKEVILQAAPSKPLKAGSGDLAENGSENLDPIDEGFEDLLENLIPHEEHDRYDPEPRFGHIMGVVDQKLFLSGGFRKTLPYRPSDAHFHVFNWDLDILDISTGYWQEEKATGDPPPGVYAAACDVFGSRLFSFGGGHGYGQCYHNDLFQLETTTKIWSKLAPLDAPNAPMKKWRSGISAFMDSQSKLQICVFGGVGEEPIPSMKQPGAQYTPNTRRPGNAWCNELHCFCVDDRMWWFPKSTRNRPPPSSDFSFTTIPGHRVAMFGGIQPRAKTATGDDKQRRVNILYILDLHSWDWTIVGDFYGQNVPSPKERSFHASACLVDDHSNYLSLLVTGGRSAKHKALGDSWLFNFNNLGWMQLPLHSSIGGRQDHSVVSFQANNQTLRAVVFGGVSDWLRATRPSEQPMLSFTAVLEFDLKLESGSNGRVWKLARAMDIPTFRELQNQRQAGTSEQILKSLGNKMRKENKNMVKVEKQMEKKHTQERKSHSHSSQQEQDSAPQHKYDNQLIDKLRHAIKEKDKKITHLQEQLKPSQASKDQENLRDKDETEKGSSTEGSCFTAHLKKNLMDTEMEEGSVQIVKEAHEGPVEQVAHETDLVEEADYPTLFQTIDTAGGIISWAEEGIIVSVPPGAVPQGRQAQFSVCTDMSTSLNLPHDFELVSPIFHLSSDVSHFEKEVEICLFHGIDIRDEEDRERMSFLVATGKQSDSLVLQQRKGGDFCVHGLTATLQVKHFCRYGIGHKKAQKAHRLYALHFLSPLVLTRNFAHGVVLAGQFRRLNQNLQRHYQQQYQEHFAMEEISPVSLPQDCPAISLDVQTSPGLIVRSSRNKMSTKIRKQEMDKVDANRRVASNPQQYPPCIVMTFNRVSREQAIGGSLQCKVAVKGIEQDVEYSFNLEVTARVEDRQEHILGGSPQLFQLLQFRGVRVIETVESKWKHLALSLRFPSPLLDSIEVSCQRQTFDCCIRVFQEWMAGRGRKPISWFILLESLQDMKENVLAQDLKQALLLDD